MSNKTCQYRIAPASQLRYNPLRSRAKNVSQPGGGILHHPASEPGSWLGPVHTLVVRSGPSPIWSCSPHHPPLNQHPTLNTKHPPTTNYELPTTTNHPLQVPNIHNPSPSQPLTTITCQPPATSNTHCSCHTAHACHPLTTQFQNPKLSRLNTSHQTTTTPLPPNLGPTPAQPPPNTNPTPAQPPPNPRPTTHAYLADEEGAGAPVLAVLGWTRPHHGAASRPLPVPIQVNVLLSASSVFNPSGSSMLHSAVCPHCVICACQSLLQLDLPINAQCPCCVCVCVWVCVCV